MQVTADLPARRGPGRWRRGGTRPGRHRRIVWRTAAIAAGVGLLAFVAAASTTYQVSGVSMLPGLHPGDRVLLDPFAYWFATPRRGDVVALVPPSLPQDLEVKRIIGLPGDQLEIRGASPGQPPAVYLRPGGKGPWKRLSEPYLGSAGSPLLGCCTMDGHATTHPAPFTVPRGEYFVLGDNRDVSYDSRDYGPVPLSAIQGIVVWVILPARRFGPVSTRAGRLTNGPLGRGKVTASLP